MCREPRKVVRELLVELLRNTFSEGNKHSSSGNFLAETFLRCLSPYHEGCLSA